MRGVTLGLVRSKVKAETRKSLDVNSTSQDGEINQVIENVQQELADAYDWGFLKQRWDSFLNPGQRFAAFPTALAPQGGAPSATATINFQRPFKVEVKWNQIWQPVGYGIDDFPEFNYLDSDRNQVLDPIQRWQYSDGGQFEVWPLPASQAQVRFTQDRQLVSLQTGSTTPPTWNDSALLDLDDLLVVYHVAALYLYDEQQAESNVMLQRAQQRLRLLMGTNPTRTEQIIIGRGMPMGRKAIRQVPLVVVAGNVH